MLFNLGFMSIFVIRVNGFVLEGFCLRGFCLGRFCP